MFNKKGNLFKINIKKNRLLKIAFLIHLIKVGYIKCWKLET